MQGLQLWLSLDKQSHLHQSSGARYGPRLRFLNQERLIWQIRSRHEALMTINYSVFISKCSYPNHMNMTTCTVDREQLVNLNFVRLFEVS